MPNKKYHGRLDIGKRRTVVQFYLTLTKNREKFSGKDGLGKLWNYTIRKPWKAWHKEKKKEGLYSISTKHKLGLGKYWRNGNKQEKNEKEMQDTTLFDIKRGKVTQRKMEINENGELLSNFTKP